MPSLEETRPPATVSFREAFVVWMKIGFLSFGGPAGQIGLMHKMLVEERKWVSNDRFLHALNYCNLLPGPEAMKYLKLGMIPVLICCAGIGFFWKTCIYEERIWGEISADLPR